MAFSNEHDGISFLTVNDEAIFSSREISLIPFEILALLVSFCWLGKENFFNLFYLTDLTSVPFIFLMKSRFLFFDALWGMNILSWSFLTVSTIEFLNKIISSSFDDCYNEGRKNAGLTLLEVFSFEECTTSIVCDAFYWFCLSFKRYFLTLDNLEFILYNLKFDILFML